MKFFVSILSVLFLFPLYAFGTLPVVGISSSGDKMKYTINSTYPEAVAMGGGLPVILPMVNCEEQADNLVSLLDALVMTGGEDINPSYYGESIFNDSVEINAPRDTSDFLILAAAMKKGIPVLGICRGEQIINVYLGGSLYQDIPSQCPGQIAHRQKENSGTGTHWIYIEKGTILHELVGRDSVLVNSFHHQAVKQLAEGLTVSARAADGVVEAYEGNGVFCVQFHPEALVTRGGDYSFLPIFSFISYFCRQYE